MKTADMEVHARQVSLKKKHLLFASILACALDMPTASALSFIEAAPVDLSAAERGGFSRDEHIEKPAAAQPAGKERLLWRLQVGHMLFMGRGGGTDSGKFQLILFENGPQMSLRHEDEPIAVRIEWRF